MKKIKKEKKKKMMMLEKGKKDKVFDKQLVFLVYTLIVPHQKVSFLIFFFFRFLSRSFFPASTISTSIFCFLFPYKLNVCDTTQTDTYHPHLILNMCTRLKPSLIIKNKK